jgi:hypothetical protein
MSGPGKGGRPREVLRISMPAPVRLAAEQRAATCGLPIGRWVGELVAAHLAGERCAHGAPRPEPPTATDRPETDD